MLVLETNESSLELTKNPAPSAIAQLFVHYFEYVRTFKSLLLSTTEELYIPGVTTEPRYSRFKEGNVCWWSARSLEGGS